MGLFCRDIGLFCGETGLVCGSADCLGNNTTAHCKTLKHTGTHCNVRTATQCITTQHNATQRGSADCLGQHTAAAHYTIMQHTATCYNMLQYAATHCSTLQHTAAHCNTLQHTATHCSTLQHTATHCNTLQHTTTQQHTTGWRRPIESFELQVIFCKRATSYRALLRKMTYKAKTFFDST